MGKNKRLYILDTNVLMHDPTSLFRFEEHDVFLPMMVLEELDAAKKGLTEVSRNVRQVSRFIGDMMNSPDESLEYEFKAKLDLSGFYPSINIRETGAFNLNESGENLIPVEPQQ